MQTKPDTGVNIRTLFMDSREFYKANMKLFLSLSLIISGVGLISGVLLSIQQNLEKPILVTSMALPVLLVLLAASYLSARFIIAFMFAYRYRLLGHRTTIRESLRKSKPVIWKFVGSVLTIGVIVFIPMMLILLGWAYTDTIGWKIFFVVLGLALICFLNTRYGFLPYVRVYEPEAEKPLDYSRELTERNFLKSLPILLMPFYISLIFSILKPLFIKTGSGAVPEISYILIRSVINGLSWPLLIGATILAYFRLEKTIDKGKYVWSNKKFGKLSEADSYILLNKLTEIWDIGKDLMWHPLKKTDVITSVYMIPDLDIKAVENLVWEKYPEDIFILYGNEEISCKCIPAFNLELKHTGNNKFFFNQSMDWVIYISEEGHMVFGGLELINHIKTLRKAL